MKYSIDQYEADIDMPYKEKNRKANGYHDGGYKTSPKKKRPRGHVRNIELMEYE